MQRAVGGDVDFGPAVGDDLAENVAPCGFVVVIANAVNGRGVVPALLGLRGRFSYESSLAT